MKSFAPMPLQALNGKMLSLSAFRLLAHLLGLRTVFDFRDEFSVTDHELLNGYGERKSETLFPSCGLSRNTLVKARASLKELGYINCEPLHDNTGQSRYHYTLVSGRAILYRDQQDQNLTMESSKNDFLYMEEKEELKHPFPLDSEEFDPEPAPDDGVSLLTATTTDEMVVYISRLYTHHHPHSLAMPNPKAVKAALKRFRDDNPSWPVHRICQCIKNIYDSTESHVNKAKSPDVWIKRLPEFSAGPLGDFGRVLSGQPDFDGDLEYLSTPETVR